MKRRLLFLTILIFLLGASAASCTCGSGTPGPAGSEDTALQETEALLEDLSGTGLDLSMNSLDDFEVPSVEIDIPEIKPGSFSLDMGFDTTQDLPPINLPDTGSLVNQAMGAASAAPPPGFVPDDSICAQFAAAPDCSLVPEQYSELCEQCKDR